MLPKPTKVLSKSQIYDKVSQMDLMSFYFPNSVELGVMYTNPFRRDTNAGCSFFYGESGELLFNDFATSTIYSPIDICMLVHKLRYPEALAKITKDFKLTYKGPQPKLIYQPPPKVPKLAQIVTKAWERSNIEWWAQYGITLSTLTKYNVHNVDKVYVNKRLQFRATSSNPIYAYVFGNRIKTYRPLSKSKKKKWWSTTTKNDINGESQLPFIEDVLIITSSLKDVMVYYELGYSAVAPQGEGYIWPIDKLRQYQSTFKWVVFNYDHDLAGYKAVHKNRRKLALPYYTTTREAKDISDYYKLYGREATLSYIQTKLAWITCS